MAHKLDFFIFCSISLDPDDEDRPEISIFGGLETFLESDLTEEERSHFLEVTNPSMVHRALQLKQLKPPGGMRFSLQQQGKRFVISVPYICFPEDHITASVLL